MISLQDIYRTILRDITFEEVLPMWQEHLWPNKKSINKINLWKKNPSGYPYNYGLHKPWSFNKLIIDSAIKNSTPYFYGIYEDNQLVAVNSGYMTDEDSFRSRGLFVLPKYRNKGYAKKLLEKTMLTGYMSGCTICWSVPRKESLKCYESLGFEKKGDFFITESGLNCYAEVDIEEL